MSAASTSTKQTIHQDPQEPSHFAMIPHMATDTMNPYQLALYTHYKRVAGENGGVCLEGIRTTAKKTHMSVGKVTQTRAQLADDGWIQIKVPDNKHHPKATVIVKLINRWEENRAYCESLRKDKRSQDEHPAKATVHHMNTTVHHMNTSQEGSVHHMNERIIEEPIEETNPLTPTEPTEQVPEPAESKAATERGGETGVNPIKAQRPKRGKMPDYLVNPHIYAQEPVSDEQFEVMPKTQRTTAMMSAICWHVERSAKSPADVYRIVTDRKSGMERALLHHLRNVPEATPHKLTAFIAEYRKNEYGSKAKNPALIASRMRDWINTKTHPGGTLPRKISDPNCKSCGGDGVYIDRATNTGMPCHCLHYPEKDGAK